MSLPPWKTIRVSLPSKPCLNSRNCSSRISDRLRMRAAVSVPSDGAGRQEIQDPEKLQTPGSNGQPIDSGLPTPATSYSVVWCLMFGASLDLGAWLLELTSPDWGCYRPRVCLGCPRLF